MFSKTRRSIFGIPPGVERALENAKVYLWELLGVGRALENAKVYLWEPPGVMRSLEDAKVYPCELFGCRKLSSVLSKA